MTQTGTNYEMTGLEQWCLESIFHPKQIEHRRISTNCQILIYCDSWDIFIVARSALARKSVDSYHCRLIGQRYLMRMRDRVAHLSVWSPPSSVTGLLCSASPIRTGSRPNVDWLWLYGRHLVVAHPSLRAEETSINNQPSRMRHNS